MIKEFKQRNTTDSAKRKIKNLAKANGIEEELVTILANFTWDYDPKYGTESIGWVKNETPCSDSENSLSQLASILNIPKDISLKKDDIQKQLIEKYNNLIPSQLWDNFLYCASSKNYANLSEFASYSSLNGLSEKNINDLDFKGDLTITKIARNLFLKIFRGGSIERHDLNYLWCDLTLELNSKPVQKNKLDILKFLSIVDSLPEKSKLSDLIKSTKGLISGDKYFKQEYLQALSYMGILEVNNIRISDIFIPQYKNNLSTHYNSNEWSFPLRFWTTEGGKTNCEKLKKNKA